MVLIGTGLDRFNRLVETIWKNATGGKLVHSSYGRNRASGIGWRRDDLAHAMSPEVKTQDNYYGYDGLQQAKLHERGDLESSATPPSTYSGIESSTRQQKEDFTFDETGNWTQYQSATPATTWTQDRVNNTANQIDSLTGPSGVVQPAYDKAGNMTTMPKAGDWTAANVLTWDAWNRPVKLTEGTEETGYAYDALTRRTKKTTAAETRNYYYNNQWRAIEERVSDTVKAAYVWSPIDRWTMIRRKRSVTGTLDETRYVLKDYLDPVAIIDTTATVIERYGYEAFGPVRIMDKDFATLTASTCAWNFLFHAEFLDLDTGHYNYGFRFYHPNLGRWPSRDPIKEDGGINLYSFVDNQGSSNNDLLGLACCGPIEYDEAEACCHNDIIEHKEMQESGIKCCPSEVRRQLQAKFADLRASGTPVHLISKDYRESLDRQFPCVAAPQRFQDTSDCVATFEKVYSVGLQSAALGICSAAGVLKGVLTSLKYLKPTF